MRGQVAKFVLPGPVGD